MNGYDRAGTATLYAVEERRGMEHWVQLFDTLTEAMGYAMEKVDDHLRYYRHDVRDGERDVYLAGYIGITRDDYMDGDIDPDEFKVWDEKVTYTVLRDRVGHLAEEVLDQIGEWVHWEPDGDDIPDLLELIEDDIRATNDKLPDDAIYSDYRDHDGYDIRILADDV